jgi:ubiquinol-cytochrome c reductase cytochrome c1 subunit
MKKLILVTLLVASFSVKASEGPQLEHAPINPDNQASLQRGAKIFVNYCLNCHSAAYMRYNRLQDIGLTQDQIKENLLFAGDKVGETMKVAMPKKDSKEWFGVTPPDLTVEARARGADWLYAYLRGFYRDDSRPTGWNNLVYEKVAMPHVLWQLQGDQVLKTEEVVNAKGEKSEEHHLLLVKPGKLSTAEFDATIADLVNYLVYMSEPAKAMRLHLGLLVLLFLSVLFVVSYYLKKEFWKDIH